MLQPGHVKIAITSNSLTRADVGLSAARQVLFYDVGCDSAEFLDCVQFKGLGGKGRGGGKRGGAGCWMDEIAEDEVQGEDPLTAKVNALEGCGVLFTKSLSDPAAVRVHALKVFPVKMDQSREIDEIITGLQKMMKTTPPPLWLRKAMGVHVPNSAYQIEAEAADED